MSADTANNTHTDAHHEKEEEVEEGDADYHHAVMGTAAPTTSASGPARPPPSTQTSQLSMPKKKSSIFGASSNLVNSIVGAGIIGIPYAMRQSGLIAGLLLLALVSCLTDKSLRIIVEQASFNPKLKHRGVHTFEELASYPFGKTGFNFILINMFIMAYGAMVAYLLIIKDTVPTILGVAHGTKGGIERELIMIGTSLTIMVPLAMQRDMASLAITSLLSVMADTILVGFVAGFAPINETVSDAGGFGEVLKNDGINPTLFIGLGILSTAMACQHSAFIVSGSLENKTRKRWARVTGQSLTLAAILSAILGTCGYLGFLDETEGDVLNNFPPGTVAANGARALLAITMFFTYPMESFVARHVGVMIFHGGDLDGTDCEGEEEERGGFLCMNRRQTWTFGLYILTLIPALIVDDLGPVLSITGSIGGSCIAYIAPGLVYLGVNGDEFLALITGWVQNYNQKRSKGRRSHEDGADGDVELPVAGDASQVMSSGNELPVAGQSVQMVAAPTGSKPFWYFLGGFPIWCGVASTGHVNMRNRLSTSPPISVRDSTLGSQEFDETQSSEVHHDDDDPSPSCGEFFVAIFFVCFGTVAMVAGVGSNVYAQWKVAHF